MDRWLGPDGERLSNEVFARLTQNRALDDLALGDHEGRVDLRGIRAPIPSRPKRFEFEGRFVEELGDLIHLKGIRLHDLDFSEAFLGHLKMTGVSMRNCRFDSARCTDWRIWSTDVSACTFVGADLSRSALGAWSREGRGSTFRDTSFRSSKLSSIVSRAGHFEDCDFTDVTLRNVDFGSSGFVRCRFSGELTKVIFWDHGFKTGKPEPNRMIDVDFSQAHFREVEFRRLNLDRVTLPVSDDHMIVNHYRCVLAKTIERLSVDNHPDARAFKVFMEVMMKWVGPRQQIGIFAKSDFDVGGDSTYIIGLLREAENECQNSSGLRKRFRRG